MKIAVLSDIHGNYEALQAFFEDIESIKPDMVVSLGDNIGYGADSEAVIKDIRSKKILSVSGNHELAMTDPRVRSWFRGDAAKAVEHAFFNLSKQSISYIKTLPVNLSVSSGFFVHGFPPDSVRHYLDQVGDTQLIKALGHLKESVCFVGHTHKLNLISLYQGGVSYDVPACGITPLDKSRKYIINVGSIGQPRDTKKKSVYILWDTDEFVIEVRSLKYDVNEAARKIREAGLPEKYARILESD